MKTGDDFRFAFRNVERRAVRFSNARDQVHEEKRKKGNEKPVKHAIAPVLTHDDFAQIQALRGHQHADQRESHRNFIRDDLRRRAQRADERVF